MTAGMQVLLIGTAGTILLLAFLAAVAFLPDRVQGRELAELAARHGWDYRRHDCDLAATIPPRFDREPGPRPIYRHVVTGRYRGHTVVLAPFPHAGMDESGPEPWTLVCLTDLPHALPRSALSEGRGAPPWSRMRPRGAGHQVHADSDAAPDRSAGINVVSEDPAWVEAVLTNLDTNEVRRGRIRWQVEEHAIGMWIRGRPGPSSVDHHLDGLVDTWNKMPSSVRGPRDNDPD